MNSLLLLWQIRHLQISRNCFVGQPKIRYNSWRLLPWRWRYQKIPPEDSKLRPSFLYLFYSSVSKHSETKCIKYMKMSTTERNMMCPTFSPEAQFNVWKGDPAPVVKVPPRITLESAASRACNNTPLNGVDPLKLTEKAKTAFQMKKKNKKWRCHPQKNTFSR